MPLTEHVAIRLAIALGIGLLIGAERERRKGSGPSRARFADTHSAAISVASLRAAEKIAAPDTVVPILVGLTTNTITKAVVSMTTGGWRFAIQIIPGLLLVILAAWAGLRLAS